MKIYLDVCCLNRPFDDQSQDRIRLESEAILTILNRFHSDLWEIIGSEIIDFEVTQIPNLDKKHNVKQINSSFTTKIVLNEEIEKRAKKIQELTFKPLDALHIACAEFAKADIFLTTDDQILKKFKQQSSKLLIEINNPLNWIMEHLE